jgi:hypothetical protein
VLEHVHREVRVRPPVHRPDEREDGRPEPEREQRGAIPPGEIRATATAQADRSLREEQRCDGG